jgi:GNAT superfamily N-acetyltransferase
LIHPLDPCESVAGFSLRGPYNIRLPRCARMESPLMLSIRLATADDAPLLSTLIHELAQFEHLEGETVVTAGHLVRDGFGPKPRFRALIAEWDGQAAGYALFFEFYSTFKGQPGLFLEDVFVREQYRQKGIGKALLAGVARAALDGGCFCMRWEVLDWNQPAIDFYRKLGAEFRDAWKSVNLRGNALQALGSQAR